MSDTAGEPPTDLTDAEHERAAQALHESRCELEDHDEEAADDDARCDAGAESVLESLRDYWAGATFTRCS